ncbi:MAG TPA: NAD-dependent epimerase/dehydratase family protein [Williamwhitmania sp.]|nr:NAD-dependent epimerase/dehydratase family protein [Williamwhitmania sp.]
MQTILGANGAIGTELARELTHYTSSIRLVSRNPKSVNPTDQLFPADLTDRAQIMKAVEGSKVVYITIGFEYSAKVWQQKWPTFMRNTIDACVTNNARLVFFDNIYMYDRDYLSNITEQTPVRPTSKKGEVRAKIAQMILDEVAAGRLNAVIARAADFFSPKNSVLVEMVYKNLAKGKKANLFANANKLHNYTYSVDAAKGRPCLAIHPMPMDKCGICPPAGFTLLASSGWN